MAKKVKCPEFENHERWLVSYADMLTLLYAVFVVLYALKGDPQQSKEAAGSIEESFNKPLEDIPEVHRIGPNEAGFGIFEHLRGNVNRPSLTKKFPEIIKQSPSVIDAEFKKMRAELEDRLYGPNRVVEKQKPGFERIVTIHKDDDGFRVRLLARHFYEPGEIKIRKAALKEFDGVIESLKKLDRPVQIEGHTDSTLPKNGNNWELSALRATEILRYMVTEHNFPEKKMSAAGYANTKPIASDSTEEGRSLNRRIEIKIKYDAKNDPIE